MSDRLLFWGPTLIWATTWHVILYQLGDLPVLYSVATRFGLASIMLFAIARWRGEAIALPPRVHAWAALTGAVQFGLNYMSTYEAERHLPSGLVAVLFSLMVFTNALGGALMFGQRITRRFVLAGLVGVLGVALIFWPDIASARARPDALLGVALGLCAITFASLGNMLTLRMTRRGSGLVPVLAWSMGYGTLLMLVAGAASGLPFHLDPRPSYWWALVYLSAMGSVVAFLLYFKLAQRQGAGRAALTGLVIPVLALVISAALEGWRPTWLSVAGMLLCMTGLWSANRPAKAA
jgi:drug/metabolite transporter (DMT)-like permease